MAKKKVKDTPPPDQPPSTEGGIEVVVEIQRQMVHNVRIPPDCSVHIFDYSQRWSKDVTEPDDGKGEPCKQTIWSKPGPKGSQPVNKFRVYCREGEVVRVVMPTGTVVVVKTYGKEGQEPILRRWVHKKKE